MPELNYYRTFAGSWSTNKSVLGAEPLCLPRFRVVKLYFINQPYPDEAVALPIGGVCIDNRVLRYLTSDHLPRHLKLKFGLRAIILSADLEKSPPVYKGILENSIQVGANLNLPADRKLEV